MSDAESEPPWHLLPDDPTGFFGLPESFDRKELKRAYNTLLRRFKPDKYPQEFQKLRAAYEQLDGELRYGQSPGGLPSVTLPYNWMTPEPRTSNQDPISTPADRVNRPKPEEKTKENTEGKPEDKAQEKTEDATPTPNRSLGHSQPVPRPVPPKPKKLSERLEEETPQALYEELKKGPQSPFDYYALAILSDAVVDQEQYMFLKWILTGLQKFPEHPALMQLLRAYFHDGQIETKAIPKVLTTVAKVVNTDRFYYLTEKLFDRLAVSVPWEQFEKVLTTCEKTIRDHQVRSRVVFTCHILRRAIWLAPVVTCVRLFDFLEQNHQYLGDSMEYDLELNARLFNYIKSRDMFLRKGPLAIKIDQALRKYCLASDDDADIDIVAAQVYIANHPEQLFKEFGLDPEEDMSLMVPWIWIGDEVESRLETQEPPPTMEHVTAATMQMLKQLDSLFPEGPIQLYNLGKFAIQVMIGVVLCIIMPAVLFGIAEQIAPSIKDGVATLSFLFGVVLLVFYLMWVQPRTMTIWMGKLWRSVVRKHYLNWWRSLIGRFFAATHLSYRTVDKAIDFLVENYTNDLNVSTWLPHFYSRDVALLLYSNAVRFLR